MTKQGQPTLSEPLWNLATDHPHLRTHLWKFKQITGEFPLLVDQPQEDHFTDEPNLLYPVDEILFAHIHRDVGQPLTYYSIEPTLTSRAKGLLPSLIRALTDQNTDTNSDTVREAQIGNLLQDRLTVVSPTESPGLQSRLSALWHSRGMVTEYEVRSLRYHLLRLYNRTDSFEVALRDDHVEEMHLQADEELYLYHSLFGAMEASLTSADVQVGDVFDATTSRVDRYATAVTPPSNPGEPMEELFRDPRDESEDHTPPSTENENRAFGSEVTSQQLQRVGNYEAAAELVHGFVDRWMPGLTSQPASRTIGEGSWPMCQRHSKRTGTHRQTAGPQRFVDTRWRYRTSNPLHTAPVVGNGMVYFGEHDEFGENNGGLYAVSERDGTLQWRYDTDLAAQAVAVGDDLVYGVRPGGVYAVDSRTGSEQWTHGHSEMADSEDDTFLFCESALTMTADTLYIGSSKGIVYAINASDGSARWTFDTQYYANSAPAVCDNTVYVGNFSEHDGGSTIYAIDATDGTERWSRDSPGYEMTGATVAHGTVFVGTSDATLSGPDIGLYALDAETGAIQWQIKNVQAVVSPAVVDNTVYAGLLDGIVAIDVETGSKQWATSVPYNVSTPPVVIDGMVYVGYGTFGPHGGVIALDGQSGSIKWCMKGATVRFPLAVVNDTVYAAAGRTVYALSERSVSVGR